MSLNLILLFSALLMLLPSLQAGQFEWDPTFKATIKTNTTYHITTDQDTLNKVAQAYYSNHSLWVMIRAANRRNWPDNLPTENDLLSPNLKLLIPPYETCVDFYGDSDCLAQRRVPTVGDGGTQDFEEEEEEDSKPEDLEGKKRILDKFDFLDANLLLQKEQQGLSWSLNLFDSIHKADKDEIGLIFTLINQTPFTFRRFKQKCKAHELLNFPLRLKPGETDSIMVRKAKNALSCFFSAEVEGIEGRLMVKFRILDSYILQDSYMAIEWTKDEEITPGTTVTANLPESDLRSDYWKFKTLIPQYNIMSRIFMGGSKLSSTTLHLYQVLDYFKDDQIKWNLKTTQDGTNALTIKDKQLVEEPFNKEANLGGRQQFYIIRKDSNPDPNYVIIEAESNFYLGVQTVKETGTPQLTRPKTLLPSKKELWNLIICNDGGTNTVAIQFYQKGKLLRSTPQGWRLEYDDGLGTCDRTAYLYASRVN